MLKQLKEHKPLWQRECGHVSHSDIHSQWKTCIGVSGPVTDGLVVLDDDGATAL